MTVKFSHYVPSEMQVGSPTVPNAMPVPAESPLPTAINLPALPSPPSADTFGPTAMPVASSQPAIQPAEPTAALKFGHSDKKAHPMQQLLKAAQRRIGLRSAK